MIDNCKILMYLILLEYKFYTDICIFTFLLKLYTVLFKFAYSFAIVTSTSTPGSMEMLVICFTISDGEYKSITLL